MHKKNHDKKSLTTRMNRIEGQVKGIKRMIEEEEDFSDIIIQLNAIKSATQKVSQILLEAHADHVIIELAGEEAMESDAFKSLKKVLNQYSKII